MPNCIILRGLPGSGKSRRAYALAGAVASADDYFTDIYGKYTFDRSKLHLAHQFCFDRFKQFVDQRYESVAVDNTNTTRKEYQRYVDYATEKGYDIQIVTVETDLTDEQLAKRNVHGVPVETIRRMRERMRANG